jgi:hypothetical protein
MTEPDSSASGEQPDDGVPDQNRATVQLGRDVAGTRFEGRVDGELVGVIDYVRAGRVLAFTHTGTEAAWRGRGIAGELTRLALDEVRARGERVRPLCSYTVHFLAGHPEYEDLRA